jgi:hypothetical protein
VRRVQAHNGLAALLAVGHQRCRVGGGLQAAQPARRGRRRRRQAASRAVVVARRRSREQWGEARRLLAAAARGAQLLQHGGWASIGAQQAAQQTVACGPRIARLRLLGPASKTGWGAQCRRGGDGGGTLHDASLAWPSILRYRSPVIVTRRVRVSMRRSFTHTRLLQLQGDTPPPQKTCLASSRVKADHHHLPAGFLTSSLLEPTPNPRRTQAGWLQSQTMRQRRACQVLLVRVQHTHVPSTSDAVPRPRTVASPHWHPAP